MAISSKKLDLCRERVRQLETCFKINSLLNSQLELDNLLDTIMKTAKQVMKADACSLFLVDKETSELNIHIAVSDVSDKLKEISSVIPIKVGEGIAGKVAQTGKALIIKDAYEHPSFNPEFDKHTGFKTGAILCSPLHVQNQLVGVCEVINHSSRRSKFNGKDLGLFQMFCQSAALAVQNAQSHNALIKIERIEKEMEISSVVQSSFLPQEIPQTQRFSFAADSVPARMVGGDFYDFIQVDQDHMAVLMGDVSGKGVSAELFMARLMSDFRYVSQIDPDPSKVLEGVNSILCKRARGVSEIQERGGNLGKAASCEKFPNESKPF